MYIYLTFTLRKFTREIRELYHFIRVSQPRHVGQWRLETVEADIHVRLTIRVISHINSASCRPHVCPKFRSKTGKMWTT